MNSKSTLAFFAALIIGFGAGFFVEKTMLASQTNQEVAKLRSQIEQAKKFFPPIQEQINVISGVVTDISGDIVTLEVDIVNPFDDFPKVQKVKIATDTVVLRLESKYQVSQLGTLPPGFLPSIFYIKSPGSRTEIKKGQSITVTAGEDVRRKDLFAAKKIEIILPSTLPAAIEKGKTDSGR